MSFSILFLSNMKRLLILFVVIVTALSLLALPIAADEVSDADAPKETEVITNENNKACEHFDSNGDKDHRCDICGMQIIGCIFNTEGICEECGSSIDIISSLNNLIKELEKIINIFKDPERILELIVIDISKIKEGTFFVTLLNGGYNYFSGKENSINLMISTLYNLTYPIGIVVMVLAWVFGLAKNSTNTALDIKDKNSLIHSMLGLGIGLAAMTVSPYVLTVLTSISNWLCVSISSISIKTWTIDILNNLTEALRNSKTASDYEVNLYFLKGALGAQGLYSIIVVIVIEFVFCLNMLWLALLQVVSPIFIGLCASGITRKFTFNFTKEYFKALLMPILSLIYIALSKAMLATDNLYYIGLLSLLFSLVLSISTLGIAGKKLDKLIN